MPLNSLSLSRLLTRRRILHPSRLSSTAADLALTINDAFEPAATLDVETGVFSVDCSARASSYGDAIDRKTF